MTGFLKGKAVSQVDALLIDKQVFYEEQIRELLKNVKAEVKTKKKKK